MFHDASLACVTGTRQAAGGQPEGQHGVPCSMARAWTGQFLDVWLETLPKKTLTLVPYSRCSQYSAENPMANKKW